MPCPGPFLLSHIADYIYELCPLPDTDVGLSILVSDGMCGRKFVLWLLGQCPGLCTSDRTSITFSPYSWYTFCIRRFSSIVMI